MNLEPCTTKKTLCKQHSTEAIFFLDRALSSPHVNLNYHTSNQLLNSSFPTVLIMDDHLAQLSHTSPLSPLGPRHDRRPYEMILRTACSFF